MVTRLRAELLRLRTQPLVWACAGALIALAAWGARWSPLTVALSEPPSGALRVSLAGAFDIAAIQLGTGFGVALAALLAAAGPGRDAVDGRAELLRANGSAAVRVGSRVAALSLLMASAGVVLAGALVAGAYLASVRSELAFELRLGTWHAPRLLAGLMLVGVHATWVTLLAQRCRTQAAQLALPIGVVAVLLLLSRLSAHAITPDSWIGPLLDLRAERALRDFWWSVGGEIHALWGNLCLLLMLGAGAATAAIRCDRAARPRRGP